MPCTDTDAHFAGKESCRAKTDLPLNGGASGVSNGRLCGELDNTMIVAQKDNLNDFNVQKDLFGNVIEKDELLKEKFGIIPFSILDTKTSEWKKRKKLWLQKGIKSEIGRHDDLMKFKRVYSKGKKRLFENRSTSVFDPVLTELMYRWFCIENGEILDPFAGGSVRGIVANYIGYKYTGIELREEQVSENILQAEDILKTHVKPTWICGDSEEVLNGFEKERYDFIFTCPPYYDLEIYSDKKEDLSNMSFDEFSLKYKAILKLSAERLKYNRFLCIVISDVRDKDRMHNWYRNLVGFTKNVLLEVDDMHLYNELIYLEGIGTSAMRVDLAYSKRKIVKIHQNVLVFYKGINVNDIRDEFHITTK
jgi:DNA modification methylase